VRAVTSRNLGCNVAAVPVEVCSSSTGLLSIHADASLEMVGACVSAPSASDLRDCRHRETPARNGYRSRCQRLHKTQHWANLRKE